MMRRLFSFASDWTRSSRKSSRGKKRARYYSPGTYAAAAYAHLAIEDLESRIVLATMAPVLTPTVGLFMGENFSPLPNGEGQLLPYFATITQHVDSQHRPERPEEVAQTFPIYSGTINWGDGNEEQFGPTNIGGFDPVTFITKWVPTETGFEYTSRLQASHKYLEAGTKSVTITLQDNFDNSIEPVNFTIEVYPLAAAINPELTIIPVSLDNVDEGTPYAINLSTTHSSAQYKINWGDGFVTGASGNSDIPTPTSHAYADNLFTGSYQIFGAVSADGMNWQFRMGPDFLVLDVAPVGEISGALNAVAGEAYTLNLSTTDPGDDVMIEWFIDWNFDGENPNPTEVHEGFTSITHIFDTPGTYTIFAAGFDIDGHLVLPNTWTVTVTEGAAEAPIADAGGPYTTLVGLPITLTGSGSGGAGNYTFAWDLDGDDVFGEAGEVGQNVAFDPGGTPGAKTVRLRVTDQNNVVSEIVTATVNVQATGAMVVDNTLHVVGSSTLSDNVSVTVSGGNLIVNNGSGPQSFSLSTVQELNIRTGGGDDVIQIAAPSSIPVFIDTGDGNDSVSVVSAGDGPGPQLFSLSSSPELNIHTGAGNDIIQIAAAVTVPTIVDAGDGNDIIIGGSGRSVLIGGAGNDIIYGGAGDDVLLGGIGNDLVLGGAGNDVLVGGGGVDILEGGAGQDLLVGGIGNDILLGGAGDDILIGGWTIHDGNVAALDSIMGIWSGPGTLNDRIALLTAVGGLLEANEAVFDDNALDVITGGAGADLIFGDRSLLGDGVIDLIALQSAQDRLIALN